MDINKYRNQATAARKAAQRVEDMQVRRVLLNMARDNEELIQHISQMNPSLPPRPEVEFNLDEFP